MSLRIHICRDHDSALRIIDIEKRMLGQPNPVATILIEPDIVILDYSQNFNDPVQVNENKVCVLFQDADDVPPAEMGAGGEGPGLAEG